MFWKIAKFEFDYQIKQPAFYVISGLFFILSFMAMASDNVRIGSPGGVTPSARFIQPGPLAGTARLGSPAATASRWHPHVDHAMEGFDRRVDYRRRRN